MTRDYHPENDHDYAVQTMHRFAELLEEALEWHYDARHDDDKRGAGCSCPFYEKIREALRSHGFID